MKIDVWLILMYNQKLEEEDQNLLRETSNTVENEEPLTPEKAPSPPKLERQVNRYRSNQRIERLVSFAF